LAKVDWSIKDSSDVIGIALKRYQRFLEQQGRRPSTVTSYLFHAEKYLRFANTERPSEDAKDIIEGQKPPIKMSIEDMIKSVVEAGYEVKKKPIAGE
jgi:hypothetical protein